MFDSFSDPRSDPMAEVVALLKPAPSISKLVEAGGQWLVERRDMHSPFYCALVEGSCFLTIEGHAPLRLTAGDFVLVPNVYAFTLSSISAPPASSLNSPSSPIEISPGTFRLGAADAPVDVRALVGHCSFGVAESDLLLSLLPDVLHIRDEGRLTALVRMIHEDIRDHRFAGDMVLTRLLEVLMIEALRTTSRVTLPPGLLRGLSDPRLAAALREVHAKVSGSLSVAELAKAAAMSRSAFFDRFRQDVGMAPMEYVAAWRMALAKNMLCKGGLTNAEIAQQIGYGSASAFGLAFTRQVGLSPGAFARNKAAEFDA
jgi:AraC-like DNA-binding protein